MSSIKPFRQFLEASDEFNLMKDLEDIGAKERTWTKEQVHSALEDVDGLSISMVDLLTTIVLNIILTKEDSR